MAVTWLLPLVSVALTQLVAQLSGMWTAPPQREEEQREEPASLSSRFNSSENRLVSNGWGMRGGGVILLPFHGGASPAFGGTRKAPGLQHPRRYWASRKGLLFPEEEHMLDALPRGRPTPPSGSTCGHTWMPKQTAGLSLQACHTVCTHPLLM